MGPAPLSVTIYHLDGTREAIDDVDFLSFVNGETYGKPPVLTEVEGDVRVLYVNTSGVAAVVADRDWQPTSG